jgi:hypothetical protein
VHVETETHLRMKMKFALNMHTQILDKICSQYKGVSETVLIIKYFCPSRKRDD